MKLDYAERFIKSLEDAPPLIQKAFYKQSRLLLENLRHPSLHAKKYDEARDIWQARVTRDWRLYFRIVADTYYLIDIIRHPK
jgi:mRNA-degrading endonuclease RelE of RelBE toxin-antitoxin system